MSCLQPEIRPCLSDPKQCAFKPLIIIELDFEKLKSLNHGDGYVYINSSVSRLIKNV